MMRRILSMERARTAGFACALAGLALGLAGAAHAQGSTAPGAAAPAAGPGAALPGAAVPGAANQTVLLQYRVEVAGTYGLRIDVTLRQQADRYAIDARVRKEGILATLTSKYRADNVAIGRLANGAAVPIFGTGRIEVTSDIRTYRFTYGGDGNYAVLDEPPHKFKPGREVSDAQRRGSFDPLTAVAVALLGRPDPCAAPIGVFDSRRRFDLQMLSSREAALPQQDGPKAVGPARRCEVAMRRIAGYTTNDKDTAADKPSRLWLARFDDSGRMYPARIEVDTGFGQLVVWLESIKSRPHTAEDRAAFNR